jgi:hypothetical protein
MRSRALPLSIQRHCVFVKNSRIPRYKTFKQEAQRGKSSTGWFYGFKFHIIVDDCGEILSFSITKTG